jgi:hypothetical protein
MGTPLLITWLWSRTGGGWQAVVGSITCYSTSTSTGPSTTSALRNLSHMTESSRPSQSNTKPEIQTSLQTTWTTTNIPDGSNAQPPMGSARPTYYTTDGNVPPKMGSAERPSQINGNMNAPDQVYSAQSSNRPHPNALSHLILPRYSFSIPIHLFRIIYMNK